MRNYLGKNEFWLLGQMNPDLDVWHDRNSCQRNFTKEKLFSGSELCWSENWKGEEIHYRSNYEKEYYSILDEKKLDYEVEKLRIIYYDTQKKKTRIAIPDIYIKDMNEIIEIKSKWTLDEINMKDKVKAYKELGYKVVLMIGEGNKNFFKNAKEIVY